MILKSKGNYSYYSSEQSGGRARLQHVAMHEDATRALYLSLQSVCEDQRSSWRGTIWLRFFLFSIRAHHFFLTTLPNFIQPAERASESPDPAPKLWEAITLVLKQITSQDGAGLLSITNKLILHNQAGLDADWYIVKCCI